MQFQNLSPGLFDSKTWAIFYIDSKWNPTECLRSSLTGLSNCYAVFLLTQGNSFMEQNICIYKVHLFYTFIYLLNVFFSSQLDYCNVCLWAEMMCSFHLFSPHLEICKANIQIYAEKSEISYVHINVSSKCPKVPIIWLHSFRLWGTAGIRVLKGRIDEQCQLQRPVFSM